MAAVLRHCEGPKAPKQSRHSIVSTAGRHEPVGPPSFSDLALLARFWAVAAPATLSSEPARHEERRLEAVLALNRACGLDLVSLGFGGLRGIIGKDQRATDAFPIAEPAHPSPAAG